MAGIAAYGAYVPHFRLDRSDVSDFLGLGGGKGLRAVASYDEDTTSMAVEAARTVIESDQAVGTLLFATTAPAYLDKTNATAIHAALGLDSGVGSYDMVGGARSGVGAIRLGLEGAQAGQFTLGVLSDIRSGLPGSIDESAGGDGAAAFLLGAEAGIAEYVGAGSASAEFLDRWRLPGDNRSRVWEERFGEAAYLPLAQDAIADASKRCGIDIGDADHLVVTGLHARAVRHLTRSLTTARVHVGADLTASIGNTGCAHAGIALIDVLDQAQPGEIIFLVSLSDGADVLVFRATSDLPLYRNGRRTLQAQIGSGSARVGYGTFLTWRQMLHREPPRRPDPDPPAAPPSRRSQSWKFGFGASRCMVCGTRHLPPNRVCAECHSVDQMSPERLADVPGSIATYTVDHLAFSLSPPVVVAVVDFDGGGRFQCEMTEVDPAQVRIGDRVEMTFRRLFTADGVHNYFWKARPAPAGTDGGV